MKASVPPPSISKTSSRSAPARSAAGIANQAKTPPAGTQTSAPTTGPAPDLHALIEAEAYFRAEQRGFVPGGEVDDWLAAEQVVLGRLGPAYQPASSNTH